MYFSGWIGLIVITLWLSLGAFLWALQSGQFSDQGRARYLALRDDLPAPAPHASTKKHRPEAVALLLIIAMGLATILASVVLSLLHSKG